MSNSTIRILYFITTGLLTVLMLFSAGNYFFNHDVFAQAFEALGYPTYLIYPLGTAKLLGLVAIWTRRSKTLLEWAYAGFFFDTSLAALAHIMVNDGSELFALIGMVLVLASYWGYQRLYNRN